MEALVNFIACARRKLGGGLKFRFAIGGALNTAFGLAIFPILLISFQSLRHHFMIALVIAQVLSLCFAFAIYKLTVFRTRSGTMGEIARFLPFYLFNYAVNFVALPVLVEFAHSDPILVQFALSLVLMVSSYFWHGRITFRQGLANRD